MPRKKKNPEASSKSSRPPFHERLKGFDIRVNTFGEMESTYEIDKLNEFLNKEVHDKKLENPKPEEKEEEE